MADLIQELELELNSPDYLVRTAALEKLNSMSIEFPNLKKEVNLHFHSFFSYNSQGWSPCRIAWESKKYGLAVSGIVDFDTLVGMEEFLSAGEVLGTKTVVGLETRVFISELEDKVMNSPNEPGIAYFMGTGCYKHPDKQSVQHGILVEMGATAKKRNMELMERVNNYLDEVRLDYKADVMSLTPTGNATERHMLLAYDKKAREVFNNDAENLTDFWSKKLGVPISELAELINNNNTPKFHELMRNKLMKYGGVGYVTPDKESFPVLDDVINMIIDIGALPTIAWLDGTTSGEEDVEAYINLMVNKGTAAINIIPDRNWNIKDPAEKALKVRKLDEVIKTARKYNLPIAAGTEMNKAGLPFVDNFFTPELLPYLDDFIDGAMFIYGHTIMARYADSGYYSQYAVNAFGNDTAAKVAHYIEVGRKHYAKFRKEHINDPICIMDADDLLRIGT
jgi:hypothetical protein